MKGVEIKGEVTTIFPTKEFEKMEKRKTKSFVLNDSTGESGSNSLERTSGINTL